LRFGGEEKEKKKKRREESASHRLARGQSLRTASGKERKCWGKRDEDDTTDSDIERVG